MMDHRAFTVIGMIISIFMVGFCIGEERGQHRYRNQIIESLRMQGVTVTENP